MRNEYFQQCMGYRIEPNCGIWVEKDFIKSLKLMILVWKINS